MKKLAVKKRYVLRDWASNLFTLSGDYSPEEEIVEEDGEKSGENQNTNGSKQTLLYTFDNIQKSLLASDFPPDDTAHAGLLFRDALHERKFYLVQGKEEIDVT